MSRGPPREIESGSARWFWGNLTARRGSFRPRPTSGELRSRDDPIGTCATTSVRGSHPTAIVTLRDAWTPDLDFRRLSSRGEIS